MFLIWNWIDKTATWLLGRGPRQSRTATNPEIFFVIWRCPTLTHLSRNKSVRVWRLTQLTNLDSFSPPKFCHLTLGRTRLPSSWTWITRFIVTFIELLRGTLYTGEHSLHPLVTAPKPSTRSQRQVHRGMRGQLVRARSTSYLHVFAEIAPT